MDTRIAGELMTLSNLSWSRTREILDALAEHSVAFVLVSDEDGYTLDIDRDEFLVAVESGRIRLSITEPG